MQSTIVARLRTDKGIPRLRDSVNELNISVARLLLTLYNRLCLKLLCRFVPISVTFGTLLERFVYLC